MTDGHGELTGDTLSELARRLRVRDAVDDEGFETVYPARYRESAQCFWTPVSVAQRAAELLARGPQARVLDVGSGVGKMCIVGGLATRARFVGVERRPHFVATATDAARRLGATMTEFVVGAFEDQDVTAFDGVYMFNPFEENLWGPSDWLDDSVALSEERYREEVTRAQDWLARARPKTWVVTYHGFGGKFPSDYRLEVREWARGGFLDAWVKK